MSAVHRLLATVNNAVPSATLVASAVQPASNSVFRVPANRAGNGLVQLSGSYTSADPATIDVEIRPIATGAERVSTPVFSGAGNGVITSLTVTAGTVAQTLTATLSDLGTTTRAARLALYGNLALVAKAAGTAGNGITVTVTPTLTLAAPAGAIPIALSAGQFEWADPRLDFGALALDGDGRVNLSTPRLVFAGETARVYRQYKRWQDGRWLYGVSPPLLGDVPAGSPVQVLSGTYAVKIAKATVTNTYANLKTLYDLLLAISANPLVTVEGVIANDRAPGGQNAIDLPIHTSAWVESVTPNKTSLGALAVTANATTRTDQYLLVCQGGGYNRERWTLTGAAAGLMGSLLTGGSWATLIAFTIPRLPTLTTSQPILLKNLQWVSREPTEPLPALVVKKGTLGVKAVPQTLTLKYTARPSVGCDSANYTPTGAILPALLGLTEDAVASMDVDLKTRLIKLYQWRTTFTATNSDIAAGSATALPLFRAIATKSGQPTQTLCFSTGDQFEEWKRRLAKDTGWAVRSWAVTSKGRYLILITNTWPIFNKTITSVLKPYAASKTYGAGDQIIQTYPDGGKCVYVCAKPGTTATALLFASKRLQRRGEVINGHFYFQQAQPPYAAAAVAWKALTNYAVGALVSLGTEVYVVSHNTHATPSQGKTATTSDSFYFWVTPSIGTRMTNGTTQWAPLSAHLASWSPGALVDLPMTAYRTTAGYYIALTAGLTGGETPDWGAPTIQDGEITWERAEPYDAQAAKLSGRDLAFADAVLSILGQNLSQLITAFPRPPTTTAAEIDPETITPEEIAALEAAAEVEAQAALTIRQTVMAAWDALWATVQIDLATLLKVGGPTDQLTYQPAFLERYRAQGDQILINYGVSPGKFEAGSQGSAVWPDPGDAFWWEFQDADYLPLFTNQVYHSCRRNAAGDPVSTQEFALALVCACVTRLKPGDAVTLVIAGDTTGYAAGDQWRISVVGARPLTLSGGITGNNTLTWQVLSSTQGSLANYALTASEPAYSHSGIGFRIRRGTLPFALGDQFAWAVETGGRYRWRKNAGTWSADTALPTAAVLLADGLSATFVAGPAPAFVSGDLHSFQIRQPASPGQVKAGDSGRWQWSGATPTLTVTWAVNQKISAVGLLRHTLTSGATVSIALKNSAGTTLQTVTLTVMPGPMVAFLATPLTTVRSLVVTLGNATGMGIGWLYAGSPFTPSHNATTCLVRRAWAMERGSGVNPNSVYLGAGRGGELSWTDWLTQSDVDALLTIIDACKAAGDEPLVVVPNVAYPAEAALCRIHSDEIELTDEFEFQPNASSRRRLSLKLPLTAVLA